MIGVYAIFHLPSGRPYVGSSKNITRRWACHIGHLRGGIHHAAPLQEAFLTSGLGAFSFVVLEECEIGNLVEREQAWMDTFEHRLNGSRAAACPPLDPAVAEKIGNANRGRKNPAVGDSNRRRTGQPWRPHDYDDWLRKMVAGKIGTGMRPRPPGTGEKIAAALRGRPHSPERRAAISAGRLRAIRLRKEGV